MVEQPTTFLPLREKVKTRNEKHRDPYSTSPHQDRKRKIKWKKRLPLNNKLRTTQWIAKTQGVAATTQSKDLDQKLSKFLILVVVAHTVYYTFYHHVFFAQSFGTA
jgi:hypothetical protein